MQKLEKEGINKMIYKTGNASVVKVDKVTQKQPAICRTNAQFILFLPFEYFLLRL